MYTRRWPQKLLHIWQDCESHTVPGSGQVHQAMPSPGLRRICPDSAPVIQHVLQYTENDLASKKLFVINRSNLYALNIRCFLCFRANLTFSTYIKILAASRRSQSACQIQRPKNNVLTITQADQSISLGWGCTMNISREYSETLRL